MITRSATAKFFKNWWVFILYLVIYFIAINIVSIIRFLQFDVFYYDHSVFEQAIWSFAHFRAPLVDGISGYGLLNQLGDHFDPALYLLSPLYWVTSSYIAIFILGNTLILLSAIVLIIIASKHIKNKLMIFAIVTAYTLFIGMQNTVISGFHSELPALFTLSITLFALSSKKWKFYWTFLILTLLLKETFASIGLGLGTFLFFSGEKRKGIYSILISFAYYLVAVKVGIPLFHGFYKYGATFHGPVQSVALMFYPWIKTRTLIISFSTFGALPLLAFAFLPAILVDYFARFVLNGSPARIDLGLHYNAMVTLLLAYGSILGVEYLHRYKTYRKFIGLHAVLIITLVLFFHYKLHGPLGLVHNSAFYKHTKELGFLNNLVNQIPLSDGYLMTLNNLAPHLTHTHKVMLLRVGYQEWMPQIIALDIRGGQNANNYWPATSETYKAMYSALSSDPNYTEKKITNEQIIFIKKDNVNYEWYKTFGN